jgi:hypothetical protein
MSASHLFRLYFVFCSTVFCARRRVKFILFYVWPPLTPSELRQHENYSNGDILSSLFPYVNCVTVSDSAELPVSVRFCLLTVYVAINFLLSYTACNVLVWCLLVVTDSPPQLVSTLCCSCPTIWLCGLCPAFYLHTLLKKEAVITDGFMTNIIYSLRNI